MSRLTPSVLVVAASLSMLGCDTIKEKLGEKAAEALIKSQTGENVDIDTKDGKLSVKMTDEKGTVTLGANTKLPDDFPKSVPVYPGAQVEASLAAKSDKGEGGFMVTLSSPDPVAKVGAFYKDASSKGAKLLIDATTPGGRAISWQTTDGFDVSSVINGESSTGKTTILLQGNKSAAKAKK